MKYFFVVCTLLLLHISSYAQDINIRSINKSDLKIESIETYDTTAMYLSYIQLSRNPNYYNGQKIMFLPTTFDKGREYEYIEGFSTIDSISMPEYADTTWVKKRKNPKPKDFYVNIPKTNVYKPEYITEQKVKQFGWSSWGTYCGSFRLRNIKNSFSTNYTNIEGQVFVIDSCYIERSQSATIYTIKLIDNENTPVEFKFSYLFSTSEVVKGVDDKFFPVLLMGYYEKSKIEYLNKTFVLKPEGKYVTNNYVAKNLNGGRYKMIAGELTCTEVCFVEEKNDFISDSQYGKTNRCKYLSPFYVFQDNEKTELLVSLEITDKYVSSISKDQIEGDIEGKYNFKPIQTSNLIDSEIYYAQLRAEKEAEEAKIAEKEKERIARVNLIRKKYGKANADLILSGKVRTGMTREMCRDSWGVPTDINKSSGSWGVHEQWVYDSSNYLYFENGILTTIQN